MQRDPLRDIRATRHASNNSGASNSTCSSIVNIAAASDTVQLSITPSTPKQHCQSDGPAAGVHVRTCSHFVRAMLRSGIER